MVRSSNGSAPKAYSQVWKFTVACEDTPPDSPILTSPKSPPNNSVDQPQNVTFDWDPISDDGWGTYCAGNVNHYVVFYKKMPYQDAGPCPDTVSKFYDRPQGCHQIYQDENITECPFTADPKSTYCWFVRARNGLEGEGKAGDTEAWKFTTCGADNPTQAVLTFPPDESFINSTSTDLLWDPVDFGKTCAVQNNSYTVYYQGIPATDSCPPPADPSYTSTFCSQTPNNSCTASGLSNGNSYCWYVKSSNGEATSDSTTARKFSVCIDSKPTAPAMTSPAPESNVPTLTPDFSWTDIGVANWGTGCPANNNRYKVYLQKLANKTDVCPAIGAYSQVCDVDSLTTTCASSPLAQDSAYCWYAEADNGSQKASDFPIKFYTNLTVTGRVWLVKPGLSCDDAVKPAIEPSANDHVFENSDSSLTADIDDSTGNFSLGVLVENPGPNTLCTENLKLPADVKGFASYKLKCVRNLSSNISGNCGNFADFASNPAGADLGYQINSKGWFQTILGDVFSNCTSCIDGIIQGIPGNDPTDTYDTQPYMIDNASNITDSSFGLAVSNKIITAQDPDKVARVSYGDLGHRDYAVSNYNSTNFTWPRNIDFSPPSGAIQITNSPLPTGITCSNFLSVNGAEVSEVYRMDAGCFNTMMSGGPKEYEFKNSPSAGAVVLYISGDITLANELTTNTQNRLVLVVNGSVSFSEDIGTDTISNPFSQNDASNNTAVEATIISNKSVSFPCAPNSDSSGCEGSDKTLVFGGSIISKTMDGSGTSNTGDISFARDKGDNNNYPGEIIIYNPSDLLYLNNIELSSTRLDATGLFESSINWLAE
ncbi:hypothetical protein HY419_00315 [candidate division WWE3 bacterium]|nr:hypothetical protein [candidate division WWE3 bacterium]